MASSRYEKVIDLGFGKHRILLLSLGWVRLRIFEILKSQIMGWGWVITFLKCWLRGGV
jgi:hypothetical protein